jgi:hypothetical protein
MARWDDFSVEKLLAASFSRTHYALRFVSGHRFSDAEIGSSAMRLQALHGV